MRRFLDSVMARLNETFDPGRLGAALVDLVANVVVGILTFVAFYGLWWVLHRVLKQVLRRTRVDATSASFAETALKYLVLVMGALHAFRAAGVDTAALLASLGIAGLTIGFAARDSLSNLISGLLIFWDRPFVIGDLVEVGGHYGRVDRITLRSTRVVTADGRMLAVPNTTIINSTVASYTNFPTLRLDIEVGVGQDEDLDRVRAVLIGLVSAEDGFLDQPPPRVVVKTLGDFNVVVELQAWISDERDHVARRFALRERVFTALRDAGIEMPVETLRVTAAALPGVPRGASQSS